jgi:hypothetical protein
MTKSNDVAISDRDGTVPSEKADQVISRQQLGKLIERAGADSVKSALIQNGNSTSSPPSS